MQFSRFTASGRTMSRHQVLLVSCRAASAAPMPGRAPATLPIPSGSKITTSMPLWSEKGTPEEVMGLEKPGLADAQRFRLHPSVAYWRDHRVDDTIKNTDLPLATRARAAARALTQAAQRENIFLSAQAAAYWSYHLARSSFFATQGIAGVLVAQLAQQRSGAPSTVGEAREGISIERILASGLYWPISEALAAYKQDYAMIQAGKYKMPWDMTTPNRQFNPFEVARQSARFLQEAAVSLARRNRGTPDPVWLGSKMYPSYYLNSFHYQSDGWLSGRSAKVYETSTETVFIGRQDAMQRQALVPLHDFMATRPRSDGQGTKMLEVASGTGRFATFIKDNYPQLDLTQLDLSPFYLQEARENMRNWRRAHGYSTASVGPDAYLHAAAEDIPAPDASFDAVVSVYLFHELPGPVRKRAAAEMVRVVRPGGMVVINDSIQLGDRPASDATMGNFGDFNEPHYRDYIRSDLGAMFEELGMKCGDKLLCSGSKVLSFTKPLPAATLSSTPRS